MVRVILTIVSQSGPDTADRHVTTEDIDAPVLEKLLWSGWLVTGAHVVEAKREAPDAD